LSTAIGLTPGGSGTVHITVVCEIMWEKYCTVGHATDDNMAHARCMLDN